MRHAPKAETHKPRRAGPIRERGKKQRRQAEGRAGKKNGSKRRGRGGRGGRGTAPRSRLAPLLLLRCRGIAASRITAASPSPSLSGPSIPLYPTLPLSLSPSLPLSLSPSLSLSLSLSLSPRRAPDGHPHPQFAVSVNPSAAADMSTTKETQTQRPSHLDNANSYVKHIVPGSLRFCFLFLISGSGSLG